MYYPGVQDRLPVVVQLVLEQRDVLVEQDLVEHRILPREQRRRDRARGCGLERLPHEFSEDCVYDPGTSSQGEEGEECQGLRKDRRLCRRRSSSTSNREA